MSKKLTISQIKELIDEEGLGVVINESKGFKITDTNLSELFEKAREIFEEIEEYIEDNLFDDEVEYLEEEDYDEDYDDE